MVQSTPVVMLRRCVLLAACTRSLHLPQWVSFHCIRAAADGNNQASWLCFVAGLLTAVGAITEWSPRKRLLCQRSINVDSRHVHV